MSNEEIGIVPNLNGISLSEALYSSSERSDLPLPRELVEDVLDHLEGDHDALKASSLTCRKWVHRSRYHLFPRLCISPDRPLEKIAELFDILSSNLCTIHSAPRVLFIYSPSHEWMCWGGPPARVAGGDGWLEPLIPILDKLTSVTELIGWEITTWHTHKTWQRLLQTTSFTSRITNLTFMGNKYPSIDPFVSSLYCFTSLRHLQIDAPNLDTSISYKTSLNTEIAATGSQEINTLVPLHNLRILTICEATSEPLTGSWGQNMWRWLHTSGTRLSQIHLGKVTITREDKSNERLQEFSRYFQFLGPSLQKLDVFFKQDPLTTSLFLTEVNVAFTSGLCELHIGPLKIRITETAQIDYDSKTFITLLARLPSQPLLTKLMLDMEIVTQDSGWPVETEIGCLLWGALDDLLSGPSFPTLKEVIFNCITDNMLDKICLRLPRSQQKLRLRAVKAYWQ